MKFSGKMLWAMREMAGLSVMKLGKDSGVSAVAIWRFEDNTEAPSLGEGLALADALGCSPALFCVNDDVPQFKKQIGTDVLHVMIDRMGRIHSGELKLRMAV